MKFTFLNAALVGAALLTISMSSCKKEFADKDANGSQNYSSDKNEGRNDDDHSYKSDVDFYALANGITLDKFSTKSPEKLKSSVQITGLQAGEKLLGIDFRPSTGQLYGVGSTSRIYVINLTSGAARMIGAGAFTPAIDGNIVGFDFNPTVDRIRLVTNNRQNLRLNPETGAVVAVDGNINLGGQATPMLAAAAYENNVAGATVTTLYSIDLATKKLYRNNPPNAGTLEEVGSLGLDISGDGGYDIDGKTNTGLAIFKVNGVTTLFTVNDETAATKVLATYSKNYAAIAIPTQAVAYAASTANALLIFNPNNSEIVVSKNFTNLPAGESIIGLDMRPVNGQLYALGSNSRLYTVNAASGALTLVATLSTPLSGTDFGFDFNPTVDRIRIVSNTGQNLRVNPATAVAIVDAAINPAGSAITAIAYTNNFAGTTSTVLYDIDAATDKLFRQDPPNSGALVEVASLDKNIEEMSGFDIGGTTNKGYALLKSKGLTQLYRVNFDYSSSSSYSHDDDDDNDDYDSDNEVLSRKRDFPFNVTGFTVGLGF